MNGGRGVAAHHLFHTVSKGGGSRLLLGGCVLDLYRGSSHFDGLDWGGGGESATNRHGLQSRQVAVCGSEVWCFDS